jgi:hypothetical protein
MIRLSVQLDDRPFIQWEGLQGSLALPREDYPDALLPENKPGPVLLSRKGGMRLRGLRLKIVP